MILIIDKGISNSNIKNKREFDVEMAVDARRTGGMGMHIIHRSMDVVKYETDPYSGNKLIMIKYLKTNEN
jgi:anti-sigma regulatory factor (Ser/Thr protein kinase)